MPNPARAANRTRGVKATRKRTAAALESHANVVAFQRDPDNRTHLDTNPNRGKRHVAKANPTGRANSGERRRNEPRIELRTSFERIPALGTIRTKNLPTWRS
jgi:hypothetical protein